MLQIQRKSKRVAPPGGLEPPTFRLTAERASQLRHGGLMWGASCQDRPNSHFPSHLGLGADYPQHFPWLLPIRHGLVVRIAGSHPAGPGSIPGAGKIPFWLGLSPLCCHCSSAWCCARIHTIKKMTHTDRRQVWVKTKLQSSCLMWTLLLASATAQFKKGFRRGWDSNPRVQSTLD